MEKEQENPYQEFVDGTNEDVEMFSYKYMQQGRTYKKKRKLLKNHRKFTKRSIVDLCKMSGVKSTKTFYLWYDNDIYFRMAFDKMEKAWDDFAQDQLSLHLARGESWAVRFFLDHYHPGYMKRKELSEYMIEYMKENPKEKIPPEVFDNIDM
jgi:hypothetical protein